MYPDVYTYMHSGEGVEGCRFSRSKCIPVFEAPYNTEFSSALSTILCRRSVL